MLTRSGVAKRLGKSIATVRRMEGVELHPTRGSNGVHLFDPDEVDAAARSETVDRSHRVSDLAARGYLDDGEETDGGDAETSELAQLGEHGLDELAALLGSERG